MRYGREGDVFVIWYGDLTARHESRMYANEADRLYDALTLYRTERAGPLPADEPALITGDA